MSIRVMSDVWDINLPDSEKLVALALADWSNDQGECWPSIAQIAAKCSKSIRTVQGVMASLESKGHLTRKMIAGKGCRYRLHPRKDCTPAESAPPQPLHDTPAAAAPNTSINTNNKKKPRASSLPDDWSPQAFGIGTTSRQIVDGWSEEEKQTAAEHFAAHHRAKGSQFKNWQDAWSTWVLNSRKFGGRHGNGNLDFSTNRGAGSRNRAQEMDEAMRDLGFDTPIH